MHDSGCVELDKMPLLKCILLAMVQKRLFDWGGIVFNTDKDSMAICTWMGVSLSFPLTLNRESLGMRLNV